MQRSLASDGDYPKADIRLHCSSLHLIEVDYRASQYNNFVHEASTAISGLGLEVRRIVDEWTGKPLLAIVNTKGDEIAQLATTYSPNEIGVVKRLVSMTRRGIVCFARQS